MAAEGMATGGEIEVLQYPACPGVPPAPAWDGWEEVEESKAEQRQKRPHGAQGNAAGGDPAPPSGEELKRSFEAGRERGREEGRRAEREAQAAARSAEGDRFKSELAGIVKRFDDASEQYLHAVEQEVVKLALAIAARVLRREAQMDPLLLTGAVRVALGQMAGSSEVRLLVPPAEFEMWTEAIAHLPKLTVKPEVVAGEGMRLGDCVIESKVGRVELGVRSQLKEIEHGFFDGAGAVESSAAASVAGQQHAESEEARE
ncbi:MAG: FliH/SctL family protein [Terracidiphilus sp.]